MKNLLIIIALIIGFNAYSQFDATIKFKDGTVITDKVISLSNRKAFRSKTTGKKYKYKDISEMLVTIDNNPRHLFFLDIKRGFRHYTGTNPGIGVKIYQNKKVELFYMRNFFDYMKYLPVDFDSPVNIDIRRKGEAFIYSIGLIDGCMDDCKLMERLKGFFSDCPELIKMIEEGEIDVLDTIKICNYYNKLCGTD